MTVWIYAVALCGIAITAEALGLGGIPEHAVGTVNIFFVGLLIAFIAIVCKKFMRH